MVGKQCPLHFSPTGLAEEPDCGSAGHMASSVEACFCTAVLRCLQEVGHWLELSQNVLSERVISRKPDGILQRHHGFFHLPYLYIKKVIFILELGSKSTIVK